MDSKIQSLRSFFKITNAALNISHSLLLQINIKAEITDTHKLHRAALKELEKDDPDLLKVKSIMLEIGALGDAYNLDAATDFKEL